MSRKYFIDYNMIGGSKCSKSTEAKYKKRPSPPYPANDCQGQKKKGNNGKMYESKPDKNNVYKWIIIKDKVGGRYLKNNSGSIKDFLKLFTNFNWKIDNNPKKYNKSEYKKELEIYEKEIIHLGDLPKIFTVNQKLNVILIERNDSIIEYKVSNNKINIVDFFYKIYIDCKNDELCNHHLFFEGFILTSYRNDTLRIVMNLGS